MDIQIFMCQVSSVTLGGAPLSWAPGTLQDSSVLCGWMRGVFVCLCVLFCVLGVVAPSDLVAISLCSHHTPLHRQMSQRPQQRRPALKSSAVLYHSFIMLSAVVGTAVALTTPPSRPPTQLPRLPGNAIVLEEPDEVCADDHSHSRITHH